MQCGIAAGRRRQPRSPPPHLLEGGTHEAQVIFRPLQVCAHCVDTLGLCKRAIERAGERGRAWSGFRRCLVLNNVCSAHAKQSDTQMGRCRADNWRNNSMQTCVACLAGVPLACRQCRSPVIYHRVLTAWLPPRTAFSQPQRRDGGRQQASGHPAAPFGSPVWQPWRRRPRSASARALPGGGGSGGRAARPGGRRSHGPPGKPGAA